MTQTDDYDNDVIFFYMNEDSQYVWQLIKDLASPEKKVRYIEYQLHDIGGRMFFERLFDLAQRKVAPHAIILLPQWWYSIYHDQSPNPISDKKRFIFNVPLQDADVLSISPTILLFEIDIPPIVQPQPEPIKALQDSPSSTQPEKPDRFVPSAQPTTQPPERSLQPSKNASDKSRQEKERLLREGNKRLKDKGFAAAVRVFLQALRLDPNEIRAYIGLGDARCCLGQYGEALQAYEKATRLVPDNARAYNGLGNAHWCLEQYGEALQAYEKATRLVNE